MSKIRHRYRLTIDGETHEVTTNAWDMLDMDPEGSPMLASMTVVHAACVRNQLPVPADLHKFIELLDDLDDLEPEAATPVVPTVPAPTDG